MRTFSILFALMLLSPVSGKADVLQSELQRFASPSVAICTSAPAMVRTMAMEMASGKPNTAATLEQIVFFLNGLPAIDSDDPTLGYSAHLEAAAVLKITACVCALENLLTLQPDNKEIPVAMERAVFFLLFWERAIPEELLVKAAVMDWAPDYQGNEQFMAGARGVARGIIQGAERAYALLALKRMPEALEDGLFLNRVYSYLGWAGGYKGQLAAAQAIYAKKANAGNCTLVAQSAFRALERGIAEDARASCKKAYGEDEETRKLLDTASKLTRAAAEKAGRSDASSQVAYAVAAYDLGRSTEARKLLNDLFASGNRNLDLVHRLALTQIVEGDYVKAIDLLTQVPDSKWTLDTVRELGGAAGQLLFTDVLRGAGMGGAQGALAVLQGQANWFSNVLAAVGQKDGALASHLHALYQSALTGLEAKQDGWALAGRTLRDLLSKSKKEFGANVGWARLAALSALMDNRSTASRPLLREALEKLDPGQRIYVDTLCFLVMLDYLGQGAISKDTRKLVEEFKTVGEPAFFLGTALWLLGRRSGEMAVMTEGYDIVLSSIPMLKDARAKLLALNNLGVMEASVGNWNEALESLQEASKLEGALEDKVLVQTNLAALEARRNGPSQNLVQYLMSVVSNNQSVNWLRAAAGRMLLALGATEAGLKTLSLEQAIAEAEGELKSRGMYVPDQQMVVVAEPNLSISTFVDNDQAIQTELILSLRIQIALWLNPVGK